jgi:hypothetical protein
MVDWKLLTSTMPQSAIEWRVQTQGMTRQGKPWAMVVPYADARYLMTLLDAAAGPENWYDEYETGPDGGVKCTIYLNTESGWIGKQDVAENTQVEAIKGGVTDAFKRACVKWNVGNVRSLYGVGECWANFTDSGRFTTKLDGKRMKWDPPTLNLPGAVVVDMIASASAEGGEAPAQESEPTGAKESQPRSDTATRKQKELVAKLMKSHVITEDEQSGIIKTMKAEGTKDKAGEIIDWLTATIEERKRAEKEGSKDLTDEAMAKDPRLQEAVAELDLEEVE